MAAELQLEVLMQRYIDGEITAFDELYAHVAPRVLRYLLSMTSDRTRAEDLCQTTFFKLHRGRTGWIPGSPVMPWVMAIARNALYDDSLRRKRARVRVTDSGEVPDVVEAIGFESLIEAEETSAETAEALSAAIAALPAQQREALVLTKQTGMSQKDAAVMLGTTEMAVKLRVHRAYETLRGILRRRKEKTS